METPTVWTVPTCREVGRHSYSMVWERFKGGSWSLRETEIRLKQNGFWIIINPRVASIYSVYTP